MKFFILTLGTAGVFLVLTFLVGAAFGNEPCDQHDYDLVYEQVIENALTSNMTKEDVKVKNDMIQFLRELCRGQKSSWEKSE